MPAGRGNSFADGGLLNALFKRADNEKCLCSTVLTATILRNLFADIVTITISFFKTAVPFVYIFALNM